MTNRGNSVNKFKYFNDLRVIDALTNVLTNLYRLVTRQTDLPLDYISTHMTENVKKYNKRQELKILNANYIRKWKKRLCNTQKTFKELENYVDELSKSKLEETDDYNVGTEE
ncbi:unnamed protein product [Macrosiphum euphorbiae]|uniref:Uncharacterized protein n=1 Tax=Macrosiphum euphorbiae TaxID=13131 RepID=A0AAV0VHT7_9HEMI|nr:unnamed protein product [Macrosiphum euphorbiae]